LNGWCVDCVEEGVQNKRKLKVGRGGKPVPGPRCATHHRAKLRNRRNYSWEKHIWETYGITTDEYWAIYEFQGGKCYICARPRRKDAKKLSVDHDHKTGVVRGLLCQQCNRDILGYFKDDPDAFKRGADYLRSPPAVRAIGTKITPDLAA
jgi:hypothetical protein